MNDRKAGKLYICATPIGNIKDVTVRVLETLKTVDLVAAEDTRRTRQLLTHYDIKKPIISFHDKNELKVLPKILAYLREGKVIAQVSDAGTPGIADPGHRLIKAAVDAGIPIEVLPGPSALLTAAVLSGLPTTDIRFLGYFPRKKGPRRRLLEEIKHGRSSIVFFESPRRVKATLADISDVLGEQPVFIGRELTKLFEEHLRGTAEQLLEELGKRDELKGEFALVVGAAARTAEMPDEQIVEALKERLGAGESKSSAAKELAAELGLSRRRVYELTRRI